MRLKREVSCVLALLSLAHGWRATVARAAPPDARQVEARKECLAGRTQRGLDILAELYAETRDTNHIYNQGRCLQQNNRPEEAIARFREFLRKTDDLSPEERADVQRQIAECAQMRADQAAWARAAAALPGRPSSPAVTTPERPPLPTRSDDTDGSAGRGLRIAGLIGVAVGAAGLGFGAAMSWRARTIQQDVEDRFHADQTISQKMIDSGRRAESLQWLGYGVGAAVLGAGGLCYLVGARAATRERALTILPALARGGPGAALHVRF